MRTLVITRGQVGQMGSFLAGTGVLIAVLGAVWRGVNNPLVLAGVILTVVGLALWASMTPADFRGFFTGRQIQRSTFAVFSTLLLLGIIVLAYIIVQRSVIVADVTIDARFTLNESTLNVLQAVRRSPRPIRILGFYRPQDLVQREIDDQYWQLYEVGSQGILTRQYIDPIREPNIAAPFTQALDQDYYLFVGFVNDDGSLDVATATAVTNNATQERSMTEALSRLMAGGSYKVYFETSLDTLDATSSDQQGMSILNNNLRANGIVTDALSLQDLVAANSPIPRDASALIIARPQRQPTPQEQAIIAQYVSEGGSLFLAADFFPTDNIFMAADSAFNAYIWDTFGIRMQDAVVVDTQSQAPSALDVVSAQVIADNTLVAGMNLENEPQSAALFHIARSIEVNPEPPVSNGSVVLSSDLSWGETDTVAMIERNEYVAQEGSDQRGPLTLVGFANNERSGSKLVLIGDGDFLTNGYTSSDTQFYAPGNATLFMNSIGWLTGFTQAVEFAPRAFLTTPVLFVGGSLLDVIAFITLLLMPGTMLMIAIVIYWKRYRQP